MVAIKDRKIAFPRRPHELNDPDKPPHAEVNKLQPVLSVRVAPKVKKKFDDFAKSSKKTRREIMEDALTQYISAKSSAA